MRSVLVILVLLAVVSPLVHAWTLAPSLSQLFADVNRFAPRRNKASDGSIGDAAHSARTSDHNPDSRGIVHAIDITHSPTSGFDSYKFAEYQRTHPDPRVKYIISCRKIWVQGQSGNRWQRYTGSNDHCHHVHVSLKSGSSYENNRTPWKMYTGSTTAPPSGADARCKAIRGNCQTSCSNGTFRTGLCPGPASVRCCVPRGSTPSVRGSAEEEEQHHSGHGGVNVEVNVNVGSEHHNKHHESAEVNEASVEDVEDVQ